MSRITIGGKEILLVNELGSPKRIQSIVNKPYFHTLKKQAFEKMQADLLSTTDPDEYARNILSELKFVNKKNFGLTPKFVIADENLFIEATKPYTEQCAADFEHAVNVVQSLFEEVSELTAPKESVYIKFQKGTLEKIQKRLEKEASMLPTFRNYEVKRLGQLTNFCQLMDNHFQKLAETMVNLLSLKRDCAHALENAKKGVLVESTDRFNVKKVGTAHRKHAVISQIVPKIQLGKEDTILACCEIRLYARRFSDLSFTPEALVLQNKTVQPTAMADRPLKVRKISHSAKSAHETRALLAPAEQPNSSEVVEPPPTEEGLALLALAEPRQRTEVRAAVQIASPPVIPPPPPQIPSGHVVLLRLVFMIVGVLLGQNANRPL